jgi:hypothetical protein
VTARYPVDLDRVDELLGLLSGAPLVDRPVLASQLAAEVPRLVAEVRALRRDLAANEGSEDTRLAIAEAEVARLRPVVEAARRAVYPGGVNEFNGLVAAVSRFNAESPELPAQEVPW